MCFSYFLSKLHIIRKMMPPMEFPISEFWGVTTAKARMNEQNDTNVP